MRNVFLFDHKEYSFPGINVASGKGGQNLFSVDPNQGRLFVYSDGAVCELSLDDHSSRALLDVKKYYSGLEDGPSLVGLCYLSVTDSLCVGMDNGDLLNISCTAETEVECVGFLQSGLKAMEWSPDQDVVVLLTTSDTVITMTGTFDIISESDLQQQHFGENQFITVGWGKKETQFHGSEGKRTALSKVSELSIPNSLEDAGYPQICWRGDGSLFAVNCLSRATSQRFIRIFNRQGDLQYTSEYIPGLEGLISWRPSGNLIACTQVLPNKYVVCFVEKNGLKHGDFTLPFPIQSTCVHKLLWNAESTMLLIWCEALSESSLPGLAVGQNCLLLWTVNNYHWYLKQRIDLDYVPIAVTWDQLYGSRLYVLCSGARFISYEFSWCINHSKGLTNNDGAFVAVIDGDAVLLTSFRHSVIPPPMCGSTLKLPIQVSEVMFSPGISPPTSQKCTDAQESSRLLNASSAEDSGFGESFESLSSNSNNMCVLLCNGLVSAFSFVGESSSPDPSHICVGTYQLRWECEGQVSPHQKLHHWSWVSRDVMMCCATVDQTSHLCVIDIESLGSSENAYITVRKQIPLPNSVLTITAGENGQKALIQLSDATLLQYSFKDGSLLPLLSLPQPAVHLMSCSVADTSDKMTEIIVSLTGHNRLYVDNTLIRNNVTSLVTHSQFLLVTTSQHELLCCPLKKSSIMNLTGTQESSQNESSEATVVSRRVERGSRLVVAVPESNRVILQMPRGNLECIQPRALSLYQLAGLLNTASYREAFDLARKQRINLNLLVDHNPSLFMQNIGLFVRNVANAQWLSLFLTELEEEDCTTSMYKAHYSQPRSSSLTNKVHTVCDGILSAIDKEDSQGSSSALMLPYLTGLVRKKTSKDLEAALLIIKNLKCQDSKEVNSLHWTQALRHLLYLKDVDDLMDAALGMYDFDLVLLVASRSQKDPKEYLAFLNNLKNMEINYQRFSIDKHLRKWESSLSHLILCPDQHTAEFLEIVKAQDLYSTALHLLPKSDERYKEVAAAYADKLKTQRSYKEAGIMYRRASDYHNALQAHLKALEWQDCIQDADKLGLSDEDRKVILEDLCSALVDQHRCSEAAVILDIYLRNPQEAVKVLCCGSQWKEAVRIASSREYSDLIENTIFPSAVESCKKLLHIVEASRDQFVLHKDRLKEVRTEKARLREKQNLDDLDVHGESDLFSETSSMISGSSTSSRSSNQTSSSNRSSKNRRKQERKILSLKKGSRFEDLALMRVLHQEVSNAFALRDEVYAVNCFLLDYNADESAFNLQEELSHTLKLMESTFNEIWPSMLSLGGSSESPFVQASLATSNMIAHSMSTMTANQVDISLLEPQFRFPPMIRPVLWELNALKKRPR